MRMKFLLILLSVVANALTLEFNGEAYTNILVGVDASVDATKCQNIIREIQNVLSATSASLYASTNGRAYFQNVKILIPHSWAGCRPTVPATAAEYYQIADEHPLSVELPWVRQYGSCGSGSDDIFLPSSFLLSPSFSLSTKANLMLHEWTKFRYGVFEEYGHFHPTLQTFTPCHTQNGSMHFTSCSNVNLSPVALNETGGDCQTQLDLNREALIRELRTGSSSVMSMPHLDNMNKFCDSTTHDSLAPTKQNALCGRRSVSEVVFSHRDFNTTHALPPKRQIAPPLTLYSFISLPTYLPGVAFLVENTPDIKLQDRQRMIKQTVAHMINLMPPYGKVVLGTFSGSYASTPVITAIPGKLQRVQFLSGFPDQDTPTMEQIGDKNPLFNKSVEINNLHTAFNRLFAELRTSSDTKWHIFVFTSSPSDAASAAVSLLRSSTATLSVATFEQDPSVWLGMYGASGMRNLISLPPSCSSPYACLQFTSFIIDDFLQSMRELREQLSPTSQHYFQTVASTVLELGAMTFRIEGGSSVRSFYLFVSLLGANDAGEIRLRSPSGDCPVATVYGYSYVAKLDTSITGCGYQEGTWELLQLPVGSLTARIYAVVESSDPLASLNIHTTIGIQKDLRLNPNDKLTPVYARITSASDRPVIDATVDMKLFIPSTSTVQNPPQRVLKDDGVFPDLIRNDGVYSAYIQDMSVAKGDFHIGQISVITNSPGAGVEAKAVDSLDNSSLFGAALLDPLLSRKCCGYELPIGNSTPLPASKYVSLLPGFLTTEGFDVARAPPTRISQIEELSDDGMAKGVRFIAPGELGGRRVDHFRSTCTYKNWNNGEYITNTFRITSPSICAPSVDPGSWQSCSLHRQSFGRDHIQTPNNSGSNRIVALSCGIVGVSSGGTLGEVSLSLISFDVDLATIPAPGATPSPSPQARKCKSLSDDCLPLYVFWILIGCVAALLLALVILIICWCCRNKSKNNNKNSDEVLMGKKQKFNEEERTHSGGNLRRNSGGNEGELSNEPPSQYNVYVNKAYIQDGDGGMKLVAADGELLPFERERQANNNNRFVQPTPRRRSLSASADPLQADMRIYKTNLKGPSPPPKPFGGITTRSAENISAPVARNRLPRTTDTPYANSHRHHNHNQPPPPYKAPPAPPQHHLPQGDMAVDVEIPIYASVNRNGRRAPTPTVQPIAAIINQGNLPPTTTGFSTFQRPQSVASLPQNRRPQSSHSSLPRSFGGRFDASSEESDGDRALSPSPMPPLPPFPREEAIRRNPPRQNQITAASAATKALPPQNPQKRREMRSPPTAPPPPPPQMEEIQHSSSEYDDDSDNWDNDDFELPVGVSHA